jgi:hypothetical protein
VHGLRRLGEVVAVFTAAAGIVAGCDGTPQPTGDPDPGHRLMAAIKSVLSVIPSGAHVMRREKFEPRWDSCDGKRSTYGWDPVTVDADFIGGGAPAQIVGHIKSSMQSLGWVSDPSHSGGGQWFWHRKVASDELATAQLLGGPDAQPHDWSLQAEVPAAVHRVGC